MIQVDIANQQKTIRLDRRQLRKLVGHVLAEDGVRDAQISLGFVTDATLHEINRKHLGHDWTTDVLTFPFSEGDAPLAGEILISADYATQRAPEFGHDPWEELCLYVIHGLLHLLGEDDVTAAGARRMRRRQARLLADWQRSQTRGSRGDGERGRGGEGERATRH